MTLIRRLGTLGEREVAQLCDVLIDCVEGGASVGFMLPMTAEKAERFWRGVAASLARGERALFVAEDEDGIVGTIQVVYASMENQTHRADVSKTLVHRRGRKRGIGAALLVAAERHAAEVGRTVLVLDTATPEAERLYVRHGWQRTGDIPAYALFPDGTPCATTIFYKVLEPRKN
jgi:GNAT superfamily N-acetyltransferase